MKWVTKDFRGNKKVWYSEDAINKIKELCLRRPYKTIDKIYKILQEIEE